MDSRELWIVVAIILGALVLLPVLGMSLAGGWGMMGPGMMGRWGYGPGSGLSLLSFLLLVAGIVLIAFAFTRRADKPGESLEILKVRLAKGEITTEQFEQLKQALKSP